MSHDGVRDPHSGYHRHHHHHSRHHHQQDHHHHEYSSHRHHHRHQSTAYHTEYGNHNPRPDRTMYAHATRQSSSGQPSNFRYIVSGLLAMAFSVPVIIFGALFISGVLTTGVAFVGIVLLVIGGFVFAGGIIVVCTCCCICNDPSVIPEQVPRNHRSMGVIGMQTPDPGMGYILQPAQPVQPPPYAPKSPSPPPYPWPSPTPVGDVTRSSGHGPYSDRHASSTVPPPLSSRGRATPGNVHVVNVQSRGSPSPRSSSPQPTRPRSPNRSLSPTRLNVPDTSRQSGTTAPDIRSFQAPQRNQRSPSPDTRSSQAHQRNQRSPSPDIRSSQGPQRNQRSPSPDTRSSQAPARTQRSPSPDTRSSQAHQRNQRPPSPESRSSSSVYSALRPFSTDTRATPLPSSAFPPVSPVNRSSPAPTNTSRHAHSDARSYQRY